MSYSTSSLPTLSASSWRPPRTPPSTAPRQGLPQPPACKFLLYRGLQCLLQARDSCGRDVQEPLGLGLPSSAEGPGNQQKPLSPSAQICREEGRGGRKSGSGQQSVKTGKRLCRHVVYCLSALSSYWPPGGSRSIQRARTATRPPLWGSGRPLFPLPGDRVSRGQGVGEPLTTAAQESPPRTVSSREC